MLVRSKISWTYRHFSRSANTSKPKAVLYGHFLTSCFEESVCRPQTGHSASAATLRFHRVIGLCAWTAERNTNLQEASFRCWKSSVSAKCQEERLVWMRSRISICERTRCTITRVFALSPNNLCGFGCLPGHDYAKPDELCVCRRVHRHALKTSPVLLVLLCQSYQRVFFNAPRRNKDRNESFSAQLQLCSGSRKSTKLICHDLQCITVILTGKPTVLVEM